MNRHARMGPKRGRMCVLQIDPPLQSRSVAHGSQPHVPTAVGGGGLWRTRTTVAPKNNRTAKAATSTITLVPPSFALNPGPTGRTSLLSGTIFSEGMVLTKGTELSTEDHYPRLFATFGIMRDHSQR